MKVTFMRHGQLASPYDDYNKLSFDDFRALGMQHVDPPIDPALFSTDFLDTISKPNIIFRAESLRTDQTAQKVLEHFGTNAVTIITPLLNEALFDLNDFMTPEEFEDGHLPLVRQRVMSSWNSGPSQESMDALVERIGLLASTLKNLRHEHILCIAHGFFYENSRCKTEARKRSETAYRR